MEIWSMMKTCPLLIAGFLAGILVVAVSCDAHADYVATGKFEGQQCTGFIISLCKFVDVDFVKYRWQEIGTLTRIYKNVDEVKTLDDNTKLCFIHIHDEGIFSFIWTIIRKYKGPFFMHGTMTEHTKASTQNTSLSIVKKSPKNNKPSPPDSRNLVIWNAGRRISRGYVRNGQKARLLLILRAFPGVSNILNYAPRVRLCSNSLLAEKLIPLRNHAPSETYDLQISPVLPDNPSFKRFVRRVGRASY